MVKSLLDIKDELAKLLGGVGNFVRRPIRSAQQRIQNWAQQNPQQATRIINAPQQIRQSFNNFSVKPAQFDIPNIIASKFGGGSEQFKTTAQRPTYPFRIIANTIKNPMPTLRSGAQSVLESLPALIPLGGGAVPTGYSLGQAVKTAVPFLGLQHLAGEKPKDIYNPANLTMLLAGGFVHGDAKLTVSDILENAKKDAQGNIIDTGAIKTLDRLFKTKRIVPPTIPQPPVQEGVKGTPPLSPIKISGGGGEGTLPLTKAIKIQGLQQPKIKIGQTAPLTVQGTGQPTSQNLLKIKEQIPLSEAEKLEQGIPSKNIIPDLTPKQTILKNIERLKQSVTEQKMEGQAKKELIQSQLANYSEQNLRDLSSFKKMAMSKAGQEGDIETLYKKNPQLTSKVLEKIREVNQDYELGRNMTDDEAYKLALEMPTKSELTIPRPKEYEEIRQLQEKAKDTYDLVYHASPKVKPENVIQNEIKLDKEWAREIFKNVVSKEKENLSKNMDTVVGAVKKSFDEVQVTPRQKVGILDYLRTPDRILKKIGLEGEAKLLRTQHEKYLTELIVEINKVTEWSKKVPKESSQRIFKYLDGQKIELNTNELKVAGEIKDYLKGWAVRLKLPKDKKISHYITHIFEKDFIKKEFDPELAKIIKNKVAGSVYDPFLEQRLKKMGFVEDTWRALDAYVKRATRKANIDVALERIKSKSKMLEQSQYDYVKKYIDNVNLRPTDLDNLVDNTIKSAVGYKFGQRPTASLTKTGRQAVYRGALGLNIGTAIKNLTQGVNTYAKLGERYTLKGYWDTFKNIMSGSNELEAVNILKGGFIEDRSFNATRKFWERVDKGFFYFFETAEKINRGAAYYGAKAKALNQGLSLEQSIEYAKKLVRDTQFTFGSIDTPVALQSDIVKLFAQFQTYSLKQVEFLGEMAKNKEYAGLLRYALGTLAIASTLGKLIGMEWKDFIPSFRIGSPPTLSTPVEIGKSLLGVPDRYGNVPDIKKRLQNIGNTLVPYIPAGVQIKKTIQGLTDVGKGYSETPTGRIKYVIPQTPKNYTRGGLFGRYNLPEAQEYFKEKRTPLGENQSTLFKIINPVERNQLYQNILSNRKEKNVLDTIKESINNGQNVEETTSQKATFKINGEDIEGYVVGKKFIYQNPDTGEASTMALSNIKKQELSNQKELIDAQYTLSADRLKRSKDVGKWIESTEGYIEFLKEYQSKITDEADKLRIQNKIEDLTITLDKYKSYGGFKKPKKPAKITISKVSVPKFKSRKFKIVSPKIPTPPKIKIAKMMKVKPIKIKANKITVKKINLKKH